MDDTLTTWEPFPEESDSLNIPRSSMPQIASEHRGALTQFLKGRGITHEQTEVAPNTLKPSQAEYSPEKVEAASNFDGPDRSILISSDGHVLDGHHQWLAALNDAPDEPYPAIRFNAPINQLLLEAARFPSSGVSDASTSQSDQQQPAQALPASAQTQTTTQTQPAPSATLMDEHTFAAKIKAKYPDYQNLDDAELSRRILARYPDYRPLVRLSDSALKPSVTSSLNEDVDYGADETGPVKDFKPIDFQPADTSDLSTLQRIAEGFRQMGGSPQLPRSTDPNLYAKPLTLTLLDKGHKPSQSELTDAYFNALGPQASEVNRRYRNETGRDIETPDVSDQDLEMGYDPQAKTYTVRVAPTQAALKVLNAYGTGGLSAAQDALAEMQRSDDEAAAEQARKRDEAREIIRKLGFDPDKASTDNGPLMKGLARAGLNATQIVNNASALFRNPADAANDAEYINEARASLPKEKSASGRIVEDVAEAGGSLPLYAAAGPYGAPVIAYTQNLNRGQSAAASEGLKMADAGGIAHGTGAAIEDLSPVARQFIARHMAGMTNVGLDKLSGSDRSAVESYLAGAILPVGKSRGEGEQAFESTRPLTDAPATPSMAGEQFTHPVLGNLTATADQRGVYPDWVRVQDETGGAPFVVRRPNEEGIGGVSYANDSSNPNSAPANGRTPTATEQVSDVLNVPRGIQTSLDTHSLFRQAAVSFGSHPIKTLRNYFQSFPALWSEKNAGRMLNDIQTSPFAPLRKESGLYLADYTSKPQPLSAREENFMSNLIGKIPGVRASQRQFTVFLDKVRADAFDNYAKANPDASPETLQGVARFINFSTGRGLLGSWGESHALGLSNVFYSPRFALSRAQLLTTPFRGTPEARAYATRELVRYVGTNLGLMALAKAGGLDIGTNPLSNAFGTIKVGDTRISLWGGMNQLARYTAQLMTGQSASADTGSTRDRSRLKTAQTFIRTKLAPQSSILVDMATGSDFKGQPATVGNEARHLFMPISWNDIADAVRDDRALGNSGWWGALKASPALIGAGVQTIPPRTEDDRINQTFLNMRSDPQYLGWNDDLLKHNARVAARINTLVEGVPAAQQDQARQILNERFYWSRVRAGDRRPLANIQRVFDENAKGAADFLKSRLNR